jgi:hypothetical protein
LVLWHHTSQLIKLFSSLVSFGTSVIFKVN